MADDLPIERRFALGPRVGSGASGDVLRAMDRDTGEPVAVKRLRLVEDDGVALDRFRREARLLAQVHDPHVVRYLAHGVDDAGRPCLVVEWLEGEDLLRRQRRLRLSPAEAIEVARQTALGLHALHQAGIVHRDVKPANLYLLDTDDGSLSVKLIDLGIARGAGETTLTVLGLALGTPVYMSPEQARGEERVTARADIFSLGVVVFEMLAGKRPFTGNDFFEVIAKIVLTDAPRLRDALPGVPPEIDALVRRCLRKPPEERFASARELGEALAALPPWDGSAGAPASHDEPATTRASSSAMSAGFEQRVVTALFAGFPPASAANDVQSFAAVAEGHGAACYPTLGHRMIAVFGGARTVGDELVRAARAALEAARAIPGCQLGIATGRALSGVTGLSGELVARGAREIEGQGPSRILLDEQSARQLAEHFVVEGRILTGVRAAGAAPRTLVGRPTPCVGRDRELKNLEAAYAECVSESVAGAVVVTGPAGIGKSRIRYELLAALARAEPRPEVILARGSPIAVDSALGLLAPAVRRLAGILDGEPAAEQRRKLAARVGGRLSPAALELFGELAGVPKGSPEGGDRPALSRRDAMLTGDLMRAAWIAWLEAECAEHPVVLALEDLQWGDRASVSFVGAALRALSAQPFLVVGLGRPEALERFPDRWIAESALAIRLGPLTPRATERLVRAALGAEASADTVQRIVSRAEGNAFYVEELIRAVLEGTASDLPDSVLGMVQARLDALGVETKRVLRAASVLGQVFWRGGVAAVLGEAPAAIAGALAQLVTAELISWRETESFPGEEEYVFRHALVRDAAYAMIPDADRRAAHRVAGVWLERVGEGDPAILAAHLERGEDRDGAARFYLLAAEKALAGSDFAGAIAHAARAGTSGEERGRARLIQAEAHRWRGEMALGATAGAEAAGLLPRGSEVWFQAVRETIATRGRLGQYELVKAWAEEAIACAAGPDMAGARLAALAPAAGHMLYAGDTEASARILVEIERVSAGAGELPPQVAARLSALYALLADHERDLETALAQHEAALASFERAGDQRGACLTLSNLGFVYATLGSLGEAEAALRRAHATAERMGLGTIAPLALHNLGGVLVSLGRLDEARAAEEAAVRAFEQAGDPRLTGASRVYLSRILLAAGDAAAAEAEARKVTTAAASPPPLRASGLGSLARALLAQGRAGEAVVAAAEAVRLLESLGAVEDFEALIGLAHAESLFASGDHAGARAAIAEACRRVLARAARLREPTRTRFLEAVPDNARCLGLARAWGLDVGG